MNEKDWTLLITIFDEGNLNHAAKKLGISQPSLTYRIRELEKEFNLKIFIRGNGVVKFTKEGILLVDYAKSMSSELSQLKDQLYEINQPGIGILKISASDNFANAELPDILSVFHKLYPAIKFNIVSVSLNHILEELSHAETHIALFRTDLNWNGPRLFLREDPICLVSKKTITFSDIPQLPRVTFILSPNAEKEDTSWWNEYFSVPPNIAISTNRLDTCIKMVKRGFGYALFPMHQQQIKNFQQQNLYVIPLYHKNGTPHHVKLFAYYREEVMDITIVKTFIEFLEKYFALPLSSKSIL